MKIADSHAHIFPDKIAAKATISIGEFYNYDMYSPASPGLLIQAERKAGISRCLVCSSAVTPNQTEAINDFIAEQCALHPEFIGLAAMHRDYEGCGEELDRAVGLGLRGVKFHNDFQKIDIDDPKGILMFRQIARRGLPVLFHMGDDRYDYSSPLRLLNLIRQVPELVCVAAHFGGYRRWDEVERLPKLANLYFDTSSSLAFIDRDSALRLIDRFGTGKFMFGSDFPMWEPAGELKRFDALGLTGPELEDVLYNNFAKLFGLAD